MATYSPHNVRDIKEVTLINQPFPQQNSGANCEKLEVMSPGLCTLIYQVQNMVITKAVYMTSRKFISP